MMTEEADIKLLEDSALRLACVRAYFKLRNLYEALEIACNTRDRKMIDAKKYALDADFHLLDGDALRYQQAVTQRAEHEDAGDEANALVARLNDDCNVAGEDFVAYRNEMAHRKEVANLGS